MAKAKDDCLSGDVLIRIDQVEVPGKPVTLNLPKERLEPWDNEILYAESWEFLRLTPEGDADYFFDFEVAYLFFPDNSDWREVFSDSPFISIPCPICNTHDFIHS